MNAICQQLMAWTREHGRRWYDPATRLCVGPRDTLWYAIALLHAEEAGERELGDALLAEAKSADGTHTPATMLAVQLILRDRISAATIENLEGQIRRSLPEATQCEWHDGNVNHPLAAWAALILAGERYGDPTAVACGTGRLRTLVRITGNRRHAQHRQAVFSEYNSPTYTALDLWFLALIAEFARDAEIRRLALFLEQRLWLENALYFHAPSQQFAGPHSRAYLDDSLGGWSGMHCTLAAAMDVPILLDPQRVFTTNHPSATLQNGLAAIIPYHVPAEARRLAFEKPLPSELRVMTYGESYHENHATRGFEDGLYPGGWSRLTTFHAPEFCIGTAERPYVNAGHADAFMARWRRRPEVTAVADARALFCRGVFNDAIIGQPNRVHVTGGRTDESYLYEEGRTCTLQAQNRALVLYAPKGVGYRDVSGFRVDVMFSWDAPFDEFRIDDRAVDPVQPATLAANSRFLFRDGEVLGVLVPLAPQPAASATPVQVRVAGGCLIVSIANYAGAVRDFERDELRGWSNGFYCELWSPSEFADLDALWAHAQKIEVRDLAPGAGRNRQVTVTSAGPTLALTHNPWSEEVVSATINGRPADLEHFEATDLTTGQPLLNPATLYGSEAWAQFGGDK